MSDESERPAADPPGQRSRTRLFHRLALVQAVLLVAAVVFALPVAFSSMSTQLTERQARTLYDFPDGEPATAESEEVAAGTENFFNIAAIDLDEDVGSLTLAISGHRICADECATVNFTFFSLDDDASVRRALPPSAPLTLTPDQAIFSQTVQLPVRGQPSQYPFDDYAIWLGLAGSVGEEGLTVPITPELRTGQAVMTTQNQLRDFLMKPPIEIDPERVQAIADPLDFVGVQELRFERPAHLGILTVLLILLIAVSAIMAVAMRTMSELIVGVGTLILGIWGVRSVLVPTPLPVVTSVDLALSVIILFVLLGLSIRAAHYFHKQSDLPPIAWRRRG